MVQKKVPSELGIQAENFNSGKRLPNLKLSSSEHQDGKSRGDDMKKRMKKSRTIELSNFGAIQSSASRRSSTQPGKAPPLHVSTTAASPQKQKPLVRTNGSPNYMKRTSSSDARKELSLVNLQNNQSGSDCKNIPRKFLSNSNTIYVSSKKSAKTLRRSSSVNLVRTFAKTPSFKASRPCLEKSTRAALCADLNAPERATCSSTLKDSKFPGYLMLNPGATESEGTSVMKVCPYTYCSLNCHRHASLPPLKSFISTRRRLLKIQKRTKQEALSPQTLERPCETKKETDIEHSVCDGKPANKAETCNLMITSLEQETGMDFFIESHAKEQEGKPTGDDEIRNFDSVKDLKDEEDIKFIIEEDGVKQVPPSVADSPVDSKIDHKKYSKENFDVFAIEADSKGSDIQKQDAEDADEIHMTSWFHEENSMGIYSSEISYDGEYVENIEMNAQATDMEREEEQFCAFDHVGDTDSKVEPLSENLHDVSVMWLDDILNSYYADIEIEETLQQANTEERTCSEAQPRGTYSVMEGTNGNMEIHETGYQPNGISCNQSSSTKEVFQHLTSAEDIERENENTVDDDASCATATIVLDEEMAENSQGHKRSETRKIDETYKDSNSSLENSDENTIQEHQIHSSHVPGKSIIVVQDQELLEEDQDKAKKFQNTSCTGNEEQNTGKNWKGEARRKIPVQHDEMMRKFNPREPNFLPLVPEPEPEKVNLKHQTMDDRKNAEEWMLDYALRQAVTKLAPTGKRKVALLVEAFETVMPIPNCETHMRKPFAHARPIQACS